MFLTKIFLASKKQQRPDIHVGIRSRLTGHVWGPRLTNYDYLLLPFLRLRFVREASRLLGAIYEAPPANMADDTAVDNKILNN